MTEAISKENAACTFKPITLGSVHCKMQDNDEKLGGKVENLSLDRLVYTASTISVKMWDNENLQGKVEI